LVISGPNDMKGSKIAAGDIENSSSLQLLLLLLILRRQHLLAY
jgi:hypothetical protein